MKQVDLAALTVDQLVDRFVDLGIQQYKVLLVDDSKRYNPRRKRMAAIEKQLKSRPGDQRRALLVLLDHPNMQVRLAAANATLAVAPVEARQVIEAIAAMTRPPQSGDAGMCLTMLDRGIFVPD